MTQTTAISAGESSGGYKSIYMSNPAASGQKLAKQALNSGMITFLLTGLCALAILMLGVRQQISDISTNPTNFFNQLKIAPEPITGFTTSSPDIMLAINGSKLEIDKDGIINSSTGNITLHDGAITLSSQGGIDSNLSVITINKLARLTNGATIHGNTTITGNLNVMGTTTHTQTSVTTIEDVNLILAKNNNADNVHIGITARYNSGEGIRFDSFFRDYNTGNWVLRTEMETQPSGVVVTNECTGYGTIEIGDIVNHGEFTMPCMGAVSGIAMAWNPITGSIGYVPSSRRFKKDIQYLEQGTGKTS